MTRAAAARRTLARGVSTRQAESKVDSGLRSTRAADESYRARSLPCIARERRWKSRLHVLRPLMRGAAALQRYVTAFALPHLGVVL